jgi:hypothetical protein
LVNQPRSERRGHEQGSDAPWGRGSAGIDYVAVAGNGGNVFLVQLGGHLLGDWVARTDRQATNKTRSWAALAAHVDCYHLIAGLLLLLLRIVDNPWWR